MHASPSSISTFATIRNHRVTLESSGERKICRSSPIWVLTLGCPPGERLTCKAATSVTTAPCSREWPAALLNATLNPEIREPDLGAETDATTPFL
jgi:hypothetical protein